MVSVSFEARARSATRNMTMPRNKAQHGNLDNDTYERRDGELSHREHRVDAQSTCKRDDLKHNLQHRSAGLCVECHPKAEKENRREPESVDTNLCIEIHSDLPFGHKKRRSGERR